MSNTEHPFLILTAICDASARPAAITVGHGDAMERAFQASQGLQTGGLDLVELIMSLEEEFGVKISDEDAEKIQTVQDAMDYLNEHMS